MMATGARLLLALLCGLLLAAGFAPFNGFWIPVLALGVVFSLLGANRRGGEAFALGYLFGLGYAGLGVYWIFHSIADYGGGPLAASVATAVLVALFALIPALALTLGWWVGRHWRRGMYLLALPLAWIWVEWVRSWFLTGATWLSLGYTQVDTPLGAYAPWLGVYGPGLAVALMAGALAWWLRRPLSRRLAESLVVIVIVSTGGLLLPSQWGQPAGEPLTVALLQGNIEQSRKWDPDERSAIVGEYAALTREHFGADLIVWPETALPVFYKGAEDWLQSLAGEARAAGSTLVLGAPVARGEQRFNAVAIPGETPQFYFKRHLVPFGEYVPFRDAAGGILDFVGTPLGDFEPGTSAAPLMAAGQPLGVSICYEVTFGAELADALPAARILLNVSNDAWFGRSSAPWQHLQMARMRALETGRPMIRATNTGVSAVIAADGELKATTPLFQRAVLRGEVTPREGATPYVRWRDWPLAGVSTALLVGLLVTGRRRFALFRQL